MVDCISLFSGAGGLDVGAKQSGAKVIRCVEIDSDSVATLRANFPGLRVDHDDIASLSFLEHRDSASPRIVIGGPPCQPFSKNGYWVRNENRLIDHDPRNMISEFLRAVEEARGARPLRSLLSKVGRPAFAVGGVARNFIGIRDFVSPAPGVIPIRVASEEDGYVILQVLSSRLFHDYWRTYGDGFHVTVELIDRFPVTERLAEHYKSQCEKAARVWSERATHAKEKLNSGQLVRSYDFRFVFEDVQATMRSSTASSDIGDFRRPCSETVTSYLR
jgi:hypothetical protein